MTSQLFIAAANACCNVNDMLNIPQTVKWQLLKPKISNGLEKHFDKEETVNQVFVAFAK